MDETHLICVLLLSFVTAKTIFVEWYDRFDLFALLI